MIFKVKDFSDEMNEVRRLSDAFYRSLDFSLASFIEHILSYEYLPTKSEIAKNLGIPSYTLSRKLGLLKRLGVAFSIDVDFLAIGLRRLIIIVNESLELNSVLEDDVLGRFIAFYAPILLPFQGTLLSYYLPETINVKDIVSRFNNVVLFDVIHKSLYSKAKLTYHYDFSKKLFKINWDRLYELVYRTDIPYKEIDLSLYRSVRFDLLDLLIIKELEKDPFNHAMNISKELGVNYSKVLRHYNLHVSKIVKGFRLRLIPLPPENSLYLLIRVEGDYGLLCKLANALSELIFIAGIYLSFKGVMYIITVINSETLNGLLNYLKSFKVSYTTYLLDRSRRARYTIPYTEYSRFLRGWKTIEM
ncbi:MAG: hypothetical protein QXZ56_02580 [Sulfolobales archaeon]